MRPFPLVATTRDDSNQSASAAADPSRSSSPPPLFREEENRGEDDQQGRRDDKAEESPLETEKLRAGIQHLLSSAPAPSGGYPQEASDTEESAFFGDEKDACISFGLGVGVGSSER